MKRRQSYQREFRREAERLGFVVSITNGGHLRCRAPNGAQVFTASTPSDYRGTLDALAMLRRVLRSGPSH
jgi:hypothetical protein